MKKKLFLKLMLIFIFAMAIASLFTFSGSYVISCYRLNRETMHDQTALAAAVRNYAEHTTDDVETITKLFSNMYYNIEVLPEQTVNELREEELAALERGEAIFRFSRVGFTARTIFPLRDSILQISMVKDNNLLRRSISQIGLSLSVVVLLSIFFAFFALQRILSPLRVLTKATKRAASGDFDFQVNTTTVDEIGVLTNSFNEMLCELKSNELLRNDFVRNVSHEFKTPLATIQGFAKLINSGQCTDEERAEYAKIIESESQRLAVLCNNILRLSRIENQQIVARNIKFSLDEQLRDSILLLEQQWSDKNIDLDIDLEEMDIYSDEELLQQVWLNILGNAIKFTSQNGKIQVVLKSSGNNAIVSISDNGIGMTEEVQQHIFDKFYQGDRSHAIQGNGLGLSIVKEIVHLCKGTVTVYSQPGVGSTFTVTLPLTDEEPTAMSISKLSSGIKSR